MKRAKKLRGMVLVLLLLVVGMVAGNRVRSEIALRKLTGAVRESHREGPPYRTEQERKDWLERKQRFADLWLARGQQDISAELIDYLNDPDPVLRIGAARALGRLEAVSGERPLAVMLQRTAQAKTLEEIHTVEYNGGVPSVTLRLALGRIRSRGLRGAARVEALARSVGLSTEDLIILSRRVNDPAARPQDGDNSGTKVMREIVDLLYTLGKRGEDIRPLAGRLVLSPAQQVKLRAATLPTEEEIRLILDYERQLRVSTYEDDHLVEGHVLGLGAPATEEIVRRLRAFRSERALYGRRGYVSLFRAATDTGDPRMLPLLREIRQDARAPLKQAGWDGKTYKRELGYDPNYWLQNHAGQAILGIEYGSIPPAFP